MLHWILDPEAARLHIKEIVGKNISETPVIHSSLPRDRLYLLCAFLMGCLWKMIRSARHLLPVLSLRWSAAIWKRGTPLTQFSSGCRAGSALLGSLPPGAFRRVLSQATNQHTQQQATGSGSLLISQKSKLHAENNGRNCEERNLILVVESLFSHQVPHFSPCDLHQYFQEKGACSLFSAWRTLKAWKENGTREALGQVFPKILSIWGSILS